MTDITPNPVVQFVAPELWTPEQTSAYTGLAMRTLEKMRVAGYTGDRIPFSRIGRTVIRYKAVDVVAYVERKMVA